MVRATGHRPASTPFAGLSWGRCTAIQDPNCCSERNDALVCSGFFAAPPAPNLRPEINAVPQGAS